MKLNDDKCHLMIFGNKTSDATVKIGNSEINEVQVKNDLASLLIKNLALKSMLKSCVKKAN